jgi:hypothetical protein
VPDARVPPFWLAIRWNTRSCDRMPPTVTAFRSFALSMSSTAATGDAIAIESAPARSSATNLRT